jgi:hypothetical protein
LVLNASPTRTAVSASQRHEPRSTARRPARQASDISRISVASRLLSRPEATNEGKVASAAAAATPAHTPKRGATIRYSTATAATAHNASGNSRLSGWKPKIAALTVWSHSPSGGLSTLTSPPGSEETKKKLCSDSSIDLTAAE